MDIFLIRLFFLHSLIGFICANNGMSLLYSMTTLPLLLVYDLATMPALLHRLVWIDRSSFLACRKGFWWQGDRGMPGIILHQLCGTQVAHSGPEQFPLFCFFISVLPISINSNSWFLFFFLNHFHPHIYAEL